MVKKVVGVLLLLCGIGILVFVAYNFLFSAQEQLSPIPDNDNVRILMLTPQQGR